MYYQYVLNSEPPELWLDQGGTISCIMDGLAMHRNKRNKVKRVVTDTWDFIQRGETYLGKVVGNQGSPEHINKDGGVKQTMIANYCEKGLSTIIETTQMINNYQSWEERGDPVTESAVYGAEKRMVNWRVCIWKKGAGRTDPKSDWARENYHQIAQLLVYFGYDNEIDLSDFRDEDGNLPD